MSFDDSRTADFKQLEDVNGAPPLERSKRITLPLRVITALTLAAFVLASSLPAKGELWPVAVSFISGSARLCCALMQRTSKATAGWQSLLSVAFIFALNYYAHDTSLQKYGEFWLYLLGIATFAALAGRRYFLDRNIGFIVVFTMITFAWFSNMTVQAAYEWRTVGRLTAYNNECVIATARFGLSVAWVVSIAAGLSYAVLAARRAPLEGPSPLLRKHMLWIVGGSLAIAGYLGVTHWEDWQVQTACL